MKKLTVALAMAAALGATGCGAEESGGAGAANGGKPPVVGLDITLSGPLAGFGEDYKNGAELALEDINADGGIDGADVELKIDDNKLDTNETVRIAREQVREVAALIPGVTGTLMLAAMPLGEQAQVPVLSPGISTVSITEQGNEWLFRTHLNDAVAGRVLANYIAEETDAKQVGVIHDASDFGKTAADTMEATLSANGLELVATQSHQTGDSDFSAQVARVMNADAEAVILWSFGDAAARITTQLRERGFEGFIGGAANHEDRMVFCEAAGNHCDGVFFAVPYMAEGSDDARAYGERYREKYGDEPDIVGAVMFDTMNLLAEAMREVGTAGPALRDYLRDASYEGVTGRFSFDPETGDSVRETIFLGRWQNGEKKLVGTYDTRELPGG
jgi:branched-chain amino acid transport system substrate-binding protein